MKRREFMNILDRAMLGMDYDEKRGILNDYDEHFQIALQEGKDEEEITKDLGDPNEIAKNYILRANIQLQPSDYEEAKTIDLSEFNTIGNGNSTAQEPSKKSHSNENTNTTDGNVYEYNISDVENINALLTISNIELNTIDSPQHDKLIKIEIIYPIMMNENLEQYRITVNQLGNSVDINQRKRVMSFINHFVIKELPLVRITLPKSSKLNMLSLSTERGSIDAKNTTAYTFNLSSISGYINIEELKAIESKINSVSGRLTISGLVSDQAKVSSVSGGIDIDNAVLNKIALNNVSGSTNAIIKANAIDCRNVSGKSIVEVLSSYESAKLNSVSGSAILHVPDSVSFKATYSSISSHISTDFAETDKKNKSGSFSYTATEVQSKKTAVISLSTISGQIAVKKSLA